MVSSSTKRPIKSRKGKETVTEPKAAAYFRPSVEKQLYQCRFFSHNHQMENYAADFYTRNIVVPKIMNFESFAGSSLHIQHHLLFQGVVKFLTLQAPLYPDLIKVYSNLKIFGNGYLLSVVNKRRIRLKPADWLNVANMKYEGQNLCYSNIPYDFPYDREMALATMADDTLLPYGVLITQIMQYCEVHVDADTSTHIGTIHHFSFNSLKRLNIVNVNGVWQHDFDDDDDKEQPHHHENPVQPPPYLSNPNMMTQMSKGVQDLQQRMQGMEQMQVRIQRIEDNLTNLSLDMNRQFAHLNQNVNLILHYLDD
ncbi:hypothetical protein V8G54_001921 [Vigna mungo]|uniref:Uncharacterized protein n=1 Tax=Vigna mungo TaxID=3915 RepID=A0AAQ3PAC6_VIGMU